MSADKPEDQTSDNSQPEEVDAEIVEEADASAAGDETTAAQDDTQDSAGDAPGTEEAAAETVGGEAPYVAEETVAGGGGGDGSEPPAGDTAGAKKGGGMMSAGVILLVILVLAAGFTALSYLGKGEESHEVTAEQETAAPEEITAALDGPPVEEEVGEEPVTQPAAEQSLAGTIDKTRNEAEAVKREAREAGAVNEEAEAARLAAIQEEEEEVEPAASAEVSEEIDAAEDEPVLADASDAVEETEEPLSAEALMERRREAAAERARQRREAARQEREAAELAEAEEASASEEQVAQEEVAEAGDASEDDVAQTETALEDGAEPVVEEELAEMSGTDGDTVEEALGEGDNVEVAEEVLEETRAALSEQRQAAARQAREIEALRRELDTALAEQDRKSEQRIAELERRIEGMQTQDVASVTKQAALALAVSNLQRQMYAGRPYVEQLAVLEKLMDKPGDVRALRENAREGLPSIGTLQYRFPEAARHALAAASREQATGPLGRFWASLTGLFSVRKVGAKPGDTPSAIISRAEASLDGGDVEAALRELGALDGEAAEAMEPWMEEARARVEADQLVDRISNRVLSRAG